MSTGHSFGGWRSLTDKPVNFTEVQKEKTTENESSLQHQLEKVKCTDIVLIYDLKIWVALKKSCLTLPTVAKLLIINW